jgi:catechol 2,3-dioxygenase-like lactoylglutathione lyase family enzyme
MAKRIVSVSEMDRSITFYRDVLRLEPRTVSGWWGEFAAGDISLALHPGSQFHTLGRENGTDAGTVHITFAVSDIEQACAALTPYPAAGACLRKSAGHETEPSLTPLRLPPRCLE